MANNEIKTLYRTLTSKEHYNRWINQKFTSFHHSAPGKWIEIWNTSRSTSENDYPLECFDDVYTEKARKAFISISPNYNKGDIWNHEDRKLVSELKGVCAFSNPQDTYNYGKNSLAGKYSQDLYVEFQGKVVCDAPENNGVVAEVLNPLNILNSTEFKKQHNL